ncbi:hypothetical protein BV25DRAFT_1428083 [Artomyces pyxidatus]|uniref:Uncharacterized protein n=1 Tax=Artomyces pyxidatus TaxID=48021 RepID=A0ACB8SNB6_9AGAM|nr:hypothetical protein BV25DRAFT_1428083 [Artomyces pyxidatus]
MTYHAPTVSVDFALSVLPPHHITEKSMIKILRHLKRSGDIVDTRWKGFETDPAKVDKHEDKVFAPLPNVVSAITSACSKIIPSLGKETVILSNPAKTPSSARFNTSKPDGNMHLVGMPCQELVQKVAPRQEVKERWEDTAVTLEYKKSDDEASVVDNNRKILWSLYHMLRNDPSRRFVIGITIENAQTRIWFCSRSMIFVSEQFNFIAEYKTFVKIISSLSFAPETDLGWDPTIKRVDVTHDGQCIYQIQVHENGSSDSKSYITNEVIFNVDAGTIERPATRIFKVQEIGSDNRPIGVDFFLTDTWVDEDRTPEGDLIGSMLKKILTEEGREAAAAAQRYFQTIVQHGDVKIEGRVDHTLHVVMRGQSIPSDSDSYTLVNPPVPLSDEAWQQAGLILSGRLHDHRVGVELNKQPRVHRRTVSKEVGRSLHTVHNFVHIFGGLRDAVEALHVMYKCGYVHRDVGTANILYVPGQGGILVGLECANTSQGPWARRHDSQLSAPYFLPLEVALRGYIYWTKSSRKDTIPPFHSNPLHDLEAILWISIWMFVMHVPPDHAASTDYNIHAQMGVYDDLFPHSVSSTGEFVMGRRLNAFIDPNIWTEVLHPDFQPLADIIAELVMTLVDRHKRAETGVMVDESAFEGIHSIFIKALAKVAKAAPVGDMKFIEADLLLRHQKKPQTKTKETVTSEAQLDYNAWDVEDDDDDDDEDDEGQATQGNDDEGADANDEGT